MTDTRLTDSERYDQGVVDGWNGDPDPDLSSDPHYQAGEKQGRTERVEAWHSVHPERPWPGVRHDGVASK